MFIKTFSRFAALILFLGAAQVHATVAFSSLFSNNMILQRGVSIHVWGTASEGEGVTVSFNGQSVATTGDASSQWSVSLASMSALSSGTNLSATGPSNGVTYTNVVVGDIYLCSGQSNMDSVALSACTPNGATDAANSNYPNIRMLHVNRDIQASPVPDASFAPGVWRPCVSSTNASFISNFSGMGYYWGTYLYNSQGGSVPIGLIHSAYYGMPAEAFMSLEAILSDPAMSLAVPATPFSTAYGDGTPTGVYNAIIAPLTKFNIAGVLWNQGETNASNVVYSTTSPHGWLPSNEYKTLLPALIKDWRMKWNSNFPFYIIQMNNIGNLNTNVSPCTYWTGLEPWNVVASSGLADVRWGELNTLKLPRTGMSVNIDLNAGANDCDANVSYHPKNKEAFTQRIVPWAVNQIYGASVPYTFTGPLYDSYEVVGSSVVVHFKFPNGGSGFSTSNGQAVTAFQLSSSTSPDSFVWATAVTSTGDSVTVTAPSISSPGFVRYAWADNPSDVLGPVANLADANGYLASPFRTYNFSEMIVTSSGGATVSDMNLVPSASDGSDLGAQGLCQSVTVTFNIINSSTAMAPLTLTGGATLVRVTGTYASDYEVVSQPPVSILAPGATTSFQLSFHPGSTGVRNALLQVPNNTPYKTPYTLYLQATGYNNCTPTFTPTGTWYTATPTVTRTPTMTLTPTQTPAWSVTLIDNFDDTSRGAAASRLNLWGQAWGAYAGGGSSINADYFSPGASGSANAVSLYGNNPTNGYCNYLSYLKASQAIFDASSAGFTGIQFWIYGDGGQYRAQVMTSDVTTGDFYGYTFTPTAGTWSYVQIPFSNMTQSGWGKQTSLPIHPTGSNVTGVKFDVISNDAFAIQLDELSFYGPLPTATPTGTWYTATATPTQTLTPTVTATATPSGTWFTATATATHPPDTSTYPFESANPFTTAGNAVSGYQLSTDRSFLGNGSLAVTFGTTYTYGDIGEEPVSLSIAGGGVTAHVWVPSDIPVGSTAFFYLKSGASWCWQVSQPVTLTPGAWNTIGCTENTLTAASCVADSSFVQGLGIRLQVTSTWSGVFFVDSVTVGGGGTPTTTFSPTPSPTVTASPTGTWFTATFTPTTQPDASTYPFETGVMGWTTTYQAVSGTSKVSAPVYLGSGALAVTFDGSNTEGEIGAQPPSVTNLTGGTVTAHLWAPADMPAGSFADVYVKSGASWCWQNGVTVALTPGAWNTLTFDADNVFSTQGSGPDLASVLSLGVQLQVASAWTGVFYLDSVNIVVPGSTATVTATPTWSPTPNGPTATATPSATPSATASWTVTSTATATTTSTPTWTVTATATRTFTPTNSPTPTWTPTSTWTATVTDTPTVTETPTITPTMVPNMDLPFPNPNDGVLPVRFCHVLAQDAQGLTLKVYTVAGRKIAQQPLVDEAGGILSAGQHCFQFDWKASGVKPANGLYYFVLTEQGGAGAKVKMKVCVLR